MGTSNQAIHWKIAERNENVAFRIDIQWIGKVAVICFLATIRHRIGLTKFAGAAGFFLF